MVRLVSRSRYPNNKKFGRGSGRGYDLGFRILSLNRFVRRLIVTRDDYYYRHHPRPPYLLPF